MFGDKALIHKLLFQLLDNAIKFTSHGHVTLSASGYNEDGGYRLVFRVQDTGIGIDQRDKQKIFDMFQQVDDSTYVWNRCIRLFMQHTSFRRARNGLGSLSADSVANEWSINS